MLQVQAIVPLLVCLIGLVIWLVVTAPIDRGKIGTVAFSCFQCGLLVTLFAFIWKVFRL